ncbi:MAG: AI-2E family transporter, partial [Sarcina sp.]
MKNFIKGDNMKYFKLFLVIVISYIAIKVIDNLPIEFGWISYVYHLLMSFIIALVITYITNPIVKIFNRKLKMPRNLAILATYLLFLLVLALIIIYLIPKLYSSAVSLFNAIPAIKDKAQVILHSLHIDTLASKYLNPSSTSFQSLIKEVISSAASFTGVIVNFCLGFLISIYIIGDEQRFLNATRKVTLIVCGTKIGDEIIEFVRILDSNIGTYLRVCILDSAIMGAVAFVGTTIIGANYTIVLAIIMFAMNLVPFIGPYIGMVVVFFICLFTGHFSTALITLIFLEVYHEFDSWFIQPKLIGNKTGLNPAVILLAITVGGAIYGVIGMVLATPITSVIMLYAKKILRKYKHRGESSKNFNRIE